MTDPCLSPAALFSPIYTKVLWFINSLLWNNSEWNDGAMVNSFLWFNFISRLLKYCKILMYNCCARSRARITLTTNSFQSRTKKTHHGCHSKCYISQSKCQRDEIWSSKLIDSILVMSSFKSDTIFLLLIFSNFCNLNSSPDHNIYSFNVPRCSRHNFHFLHNSPIVTEYSWACFWTVAYGSSSSNAIQHCCSRKSKAFNAYAPLCLQELLSVTLSKLSFRFWMFFIIVIVIVIMILVFMYVYT